MPDIEPPEPQRGEPAIGLDPSDHVRQWIAEQGTVTMRQLADKFALTDNRSASWLRRLVTAGDVEDTGEEEPAAGGRGRPARVFRWTGEAPNVEPKTPQVSMHDVHAIIAAWPEALERLQAAADRIASLEEDVRVLRQDVERAQRAADGAHAAMDASGMDALDVTLGAAVAGLARIGRGEVAGTLADVVRAEVAAALDHVADQVEA